MGYEIKAEEDGKKTGILFDKFNYLPVFKEDILSAKKSILIVCPKLIKSCVEKFLLDINFLRKNVPITVITSLSDETAFVEKLKNAGITVKLRENLHSNFAVVDGILIWYGSISYLSYCSADDTALRFESKETAKELINIVN